MLFGDTNEFDIDGRNCNGDMYGTNREDDLWIYDDSPATQATPPKLQFHSVAEMIQSPEVRNLIQKTIAHKDAQIRALQNELLELAHQNDLKQEKSS